MVKGENARPIGGVVVRRGTMTGGDARSQMIFGQVVASGGLAEVNHAAGNQSGTPAGTGLIPEAQTVSIVSDTGGKARGVEKHEGEERMGSRRVCDRMFCDECGETNRFITEILTN